MLLAVVHTVLHCEALALLSPPPLHCLALSSICFTHFALLLSAETCLSGAQLHLWLVCVGASVSVGRLLMLMSVSLWGALC